MFGASPETLNGNIRQEKDEHMKRVHITVNAAILHFENETLHRF